MLHHVTPEALIVFEREENQRSCAHRPVSVRNVNFAARDAPMMGRNAGRMMGCGREFNCCSTVFNTKLGCEQSLKYPFEAKGVT